MILKREKLQKTAHRGLTWYFHQFANRPCSDSRCQVSGVRKKPGRIHPILLNNQSLWLLEPEN